MTKINYGGGEPCNTPRNSTTPKEQYEARKAERKRLRETDYQTQKRGEEDMMLDCFDRFATALERIADALERPKVSTSNLVFNPGSTVANAAVRG